VNLKDVRPALHAEHISMKISHTAVDKYCGRTADLATVYNIFLGTAETLAGDSDDLSFGALTLLAG